MNELQHRRHARIAGLLYLVPMLLAPFSMLYVPSLVVVAGDAAATASAVLEHATMLRAAIAVDAVIVLSEVALTVVLYRVLQPVNQTVALIAAFARLAMTVMQAINLVPGLAALQLAHDGGVEAKQMVLWLFSLKSLGVHVWEILFAFHCALVGVLVWKSPMFPRVLGALMLVAAAGYGANGLGNVTVPAAAPLLASFVGLAAMVGEVPFVLWLVARGTKRVSPVPAPR